MKYERNSIRRASNGVTLPRHGLDYECHLIDSTLPVGIIELQSPKSGIKAAGHTTLLAQCGSCGSFVLMDYQQSETKAVGNFHRDRGNSRVGFGSARCASVGYDNSKV